MFLSVSVSLSLPPSGRLPSLPVSLGPHSLFEYCGTWQLHSLVSTYWLARCCRHHVVVEDQHISLSFSLCPSSSHFERTDKSWKPLLWQQLCWGYASKMVKKRFFSFFSSIWTLHRTETTERWNFSCPPIPLTIDLSFNLGIDFCSICQRIRLNSFPRSIRRRHRNRTWFLWQFPWKTCNCNCRATSIYTLWMDIYGQWAWTFAFDSATQKIETKTETATIHRFISFSCFATDNSVESMSLGHFLHVSLVIHTCTTRPGH